jgi:hypothetical protein
MPFAKVEVALPVTLSASALIPAENVEVALPVTVRIPVESDDEVAFVLVLLCAVKFWRVEDASARNCWNEDTAVVEVAIKF